MISLSVRMESQGLFPEFFTLSPNNMDSRWEDFGFDFAVRQYELHIASIEHRISVRSMVPAVLDIISWLSTEQCLGSSSRLLDQLP